MVLNESTNVDLLRRLDERREIQSDPDARAKIDGRRKRLNDNIRTRDQSASATL